MTTLALHITPTSTSLALADEWGGISPLLPEASLQRDGFGVLADFAQQAGLGCVGKNAEAMTMASTAGGPPVRLALAAAAQGHQATAPLLAAAVAELQRKRLTLNQVLLATHDDPQSPATQADVLAVRTAGWPAPQCLPRAACTAADVLLSNPSAPALLVLHIGFADVTLTEVQAHPSEPVCRILATLPQLGIRWLWAELTQALQTQFADQAMTAEQAQCEAQRLARTLLERSLQRQPDATVPRLSLRADGASIEQHPTAPWLTRFDAWCQELLQWLAPYAVPYASGVLWADDVGAPALALALVGRLQDASASKWRLGLDPALGAARLAASTLDTKAMHKRYARLPAMVGWQYGVLRPNGQGGTEFKTLGPLSDLAVQQKLALKTTREDQMRMVLPIGIQTEGQPHHTLGVLEFALAAPAKKGIVVAFYVELADPLLRVRGVAGQPICPVGEAFLPLDGQLAETAAAYRSYANQLGTVV